MEEIEMVELSYADSLLERIAAECEVRGLLSTKVVFMQSIELPDQLRIRFASAIKYAVVGNSAHRIKTETGL
jgi:hypothetical protein